MVGCRVNIMSAYKIILFSARSESLRSLELPLELLLSGVIYLSGTLGGGGGGGGRGLSSFVVLAHTECTSFKGGRDKRGSPLLSITQPDDVQLEALMEMSTGDVVDMLSYFTSVPK